MTAIAAIGKRKPERIPMLVARGALVPYNDAATQRLRARNYQYGQVVFVTISRPRHPGHWRLAHALGTMLVEHVDDFRHLNAHEALKAIQALSGIACDVVNVSGNVWKWPRSLAFESMDQGEFYECFNAFVEYIAEVYWPGLTPEAVAEQEQLLDRRGEIPAPYRTNNDGRHTGRMER